ncbi:MAG: universal stress protein [Paracoccaceae bacterium]
MDYKAILTVQTDLHHMAHILGQAEVLAGAYDAHLEALCIGVDRSQTGYYYAGASAMIVQETLGRASQEAGAMAAAAGAQLKGLAGRWAVQKGVAQLADIGRHVSQAARFADLVVLPQPYGTDKGVELEPVLEGAMFEGQAPVLIVPDEAKVSATPARVLIAWNESAEALAAIRAAMPMLKAAAAVHVVVVDPPQHGPNRSDPGGMVAQYLVRHGVRAEIDVLSKTLPRVADVLLRHATDTSADLLVMGGYGHSRFREAVLGGATRHMLQQATLPVLMAH